MAEDNLFLRGYLKLKVPCKPGNGHLPPCLNHLSHCRHKSKADINAVSRWDAHFKCFGMPFMWPVTVTRDKPKPVLFQLCLVVGLLIPESIDFKFQQQAGILINHMRIFNLIKPLKFPKKGAIHSKVEMNDCKNEINMEQREVSSKFAFSTPEQIQQQGVEENSWLKVMRRKKPPLIVEMQHKLNSMRRGLVGSEIHLPRGGIDLGLPPSDTRPPGVAGRDCRWLS
eukprot:Gb_26547 [translate_table: standard]